MMLTVFIIYLIVVLGLGLYFSKERSDSESFFLANRRLGPWVTAFSASASSESGWLILGATGLAFKEGLQAFWFMPGCILGYAINWFFIAPRLRRESKESGSVTLTDFLVDRADQKHTAIRWIATTIIFLCMMGYVAAQLTAAGKAFNVTFGWPYSTSVILGGAVIIIYTLLGGFRAVSWSDLVQGFLMVGALIILPTVVLIKFLSSGYGWADLSAVAPGYMDFAGGKVGIVALGTVVGLLGIGLGYPGQPHVLTRYMAARSDKVIRQGRLIAIAWFFLAYSGVLILGICGKLLFETADPEHIFPTAAQALLPLSIAGIMLSGVMSAIMSTADSQLLVATSSLSHDILERLGHLRKVSVAHINRIMVVVLGLGSIILALTKVRVIFWFVLFAWSGLGASFGPALIYAIYAKRPKAWPIIGGMLTGFAVTIIWKQTSLSDHLYELVPAFLLSAIVICVTHSILLVRTR